jgi:hypothetical protein
MFDYRRVSQERVIGLSFVDILIQAVFVLLIALFVGYLDPTIRIELEEKSAYGQVGKDLCHKLNKDSVEACREYTEGKPIGVESNRNTGYQAAGEDICKGLGARTPDECKAIASRELSRLRPCVKPASEYRVPATMSVIIWSPTEVEFLGFSQEYLSRLRENGDQARLAQAIGKPSRLRFTPEELTAAFSFIREETCYHVIRDRREGKYSDDDLKGALSVLNMLRTPLR